MAVIRWDPFTALARLDPEFDELVRRTWGSSGRRRGSQPGTAGYVPAVDMSTDGSDVVITLELPGVDVERDVDIVVEDGRLMISGERQERNESKDENGKTLVRELRYGSFRREFALPEGVSGDDVEASYDSGLLHVRVRNVAKPAVPPTKVPIRAGNSASSAKVIEGSSEQSSN